MKSTLYLDHPVENWVFYEPGSLHAYTGIHFNKKGEVETDYGYLSLSQHRAAYHSQILITMDECTRMIHGVEDATLIMPWEEINSGEFFEMLNCLPPEKWETIRGVEIFRIREYYTGNITTHFAALNKRYFKAQRRTTVKYTDLADEVQEAVNASI